MNATVEKKQFSIGLSIPGTKAEAFAELAKVRDAMGRIQELGREEDRSKKLGSLLGRAEQMLLNFKEDNTTYRTEFGMVLSSISAFETGRDYLAGGIAEMRGKLLEGIGVNSQRPIDRGELSYLLNHFDVTLQKNVVLALAGNAKFRPERIRPVADLIEARISQHPEETAILEGMLAALKPAEKPAAAPAKKELPSIAEIMDGLAYGKNERRWNAAADLASLAEARPDEVVGKASAIFPLVFEPEQRIYARAFRALSALIGRREVSEEIALPLIGKWAVGGKDDEHRAAKLLGEIAKDNPSVLVRHVARISSVAVEGDGRYQLACALLGKVAAAEPLSYDVREALGTMLDSALSAEKSQSGRYLDFKGNVLEPLLEAKVSDGHLKALIEAMGLRLDDYAYKDDPRATRLLDAFELVARKRRDLVPGDTERAAKRAAVSSDSGLKRYSEALLKALGK